MVRMSINYTKLENTHYQVCAIRSNFCYFANDERETYL
jgi:hypothetical protein